MDWQSANFEQIRGLIWDLGSGTHDLGMNEYLFKPPFGVIKEQFRVNTSQTAKTSEATESHC